MFPLEYLVFPFFRSDTKKILSTLLIKALQIKIEIGIKNAMEERFNKCRKDYTFIKGSHVYLKVQNP